MLRLNKGSGAATEVVVSLSGLFPHHCALFLDLDGTLIDIAESPEQVVVPSDLSDTLIFVQRSLGGACAIISGRSLEVIDQFISPAHLPAAGVHGAELRMPDDSLRVVAGDWLSDKGRAMIRSLALGCPELIVEEKSLAIAVHFRAVPELGLFVKEKLDEVAEAADGLLTVQPGKMVFEILPANISKGRALDQFMDSSPFIGRYPIAIGDDLTDETMFAAAQQRGGLGIHVGRRPVDTLASLRMPDAAAVRDWLANMAAKRPLSSPMAIG